MKQIPIKLGPLTLLLTVISICLTVLAILSFTTARADLRLAEKYADTVRSRYALEKQGQAFRQELSETDPADYGLSGWERGSDGVYRTVLTQDDLSLSIGFCPNEKGKTDILQWQNALLSLRDDQGKGYSQTYLRSVHNQLNAIFNHAVKYYDLPKNPCLSNKKMGKVRTREMLFWTKEEYLTFAEKLEEHPEIETVFIITDSESGYRNMISGLNVRASYQLYRDYLDNFRINAPRR